MPLRILVSGSSGPIGSELISQSQSRGYEISRLVRRTPAHSGEVQWDPKKPVNPQSVSGFDAVVHLAGETIVGCWTDAKKTAIRESRVIGTRHLAEALVQANKPPQVMVSASAVGFYGDRGEEILHEDSAPGSGFLPDVCQQWEAASAPAADAGIRVVHIRTGLVLSPAGGALAAMRTPFRLGVGGKMGSGKQWWSWIDVRDLASAMLFAIGTETLRGPVNGVSLNAVTNSEFTRVLAKAVSRPAIFPLPAFAARLVLGQMADELLLASQHVEPTRLLASGFQFRYGELPVSLRANLQS